MANNSGGEGKGHSKVPPTPQEQNAIRREAKRRRRTGARHPDSSPLMTAPRRQQQSAPAAHNPDLKARLYAEYLQMAYHTALQHLMSFGDQQVPGYSDNRPRWTVNAKAAAERLLRLYFFGPADEIEASESQTGQRVVDEVRRRFAGSCYLNSAIADTPGQAQSWFAEVLALSERFHTARRATKRAAAAA